MTKKIYLEPLKSVLGQSILHYCWLYQILPITTGILVIDIVSRNSPKISDLSMRDFFQLISSLID